MWPILFLRRRIETNLCSWRWRSLSRPAISAWCIWWARQDLSTTNCLIKTHRFCQISLGCSESEMIDQNQEYYLNLYLSNLPQYYSFNLIYYYVNCNKQYANLISWENAAGFCLSPLLNNLAALAHQNFIYFWASWRSSTLRFLSKITSLNP